MNLRTKDSHPDRAQRDMLEPYTPMPVEVLAPRRGDKETGIGLVLLKAVEEACKGDPLRQADEFFVRFRIPSGTGLKREASIQTKRDYIWRLKSSLRELASLNIKIQNLRELSKKQITQLVRKWVRDGRSASTMANKVTVLHRMGVWMGKPHLCPALPDLLAEIGEDPDLARRQYSAIASKAVTAKNIDPQELFCQMDELCVVAGLQLRLQLHFGLRVLETVMFKPFAADMGKELFLVDGTKGGKARVIPIETAEQRTLLDEAKVMATSNRKGILTDKNRKLQQAVSHYYYLCSKIGLTRKDLGATSHGLRHTFANAQYKKITGVDSPVNGGERIPHRQEIAARREVSELLGHFRPSVTSAYLGNHVTLGRSRRANIKGLLAKLEASHELRELIKTEGVTSVWVVGPEASGAPIGSHMMISMQTAGEGGEVAPDAGSRIGAVVGRIMGKPCFCITYASFRQQNIEGLELIGLTQERALATTSPVGF
ncbi:site-specific integrase [Rhodoferax sp.]|uniref:tyrosine-type recombinase/integrase n=1 Tax=Rhodoferax sp. TaxID=50421 RepID=UPI0026076564|nr:site-specific integrase [Rhodoferax sp.]